MYKRQWKNGKEGGRNFWKDDGKTLRNYFGSSQENAQNKYRQYQNKEMFYMGHAMPNTKHATLTIG